ncbi:hypothetical protein [Bifidobacterium choloepi]|uniref:Uncharacterized protein n=1 Tax=Bifidobacterium choloepi TaxID=2614131 RepID=A0A6I5NCM4_9BIFI|nr:hypothetical protein [Bifidobacterium choloepi]NEG69224.1 hypothetical protein [Bifidobacterium choloepi]
MGWVWVVIAVILLGVGGWYAHEYALDRKAAKLSKGNDEDRQLAKDMQDIARKIDEGKYLYR